MIERLKIVLLVGLILLSLYLTYILWFGSPYLEEGVLPRYKFAFFTPLPTPDALLPPTAVVLQRQGTEEIILFRRGTREFDRIWQAAYEFLQRKLPGALGERPGEKEIEEILQEVSFELLFRFNPPLPESFLWNRGAFPEELHTIRLFSSGGKNYALLEGKEKVLYCWIDQEEIELEEILSAAAINDAPTAEKLLQSFVLQVMHPLDGNREVAIVVPLSKNEKDEDEGENRADTNSGDGVHGEVKEDASEAGPKAEDASDPVPEDKDGAAPAIKSEAEPVSADEKEDESIPPANEFIEYWAITVHSNIYIPNLLEASELYLTQEELPGKELVSAFFLDPAMARRIEERDGAIYFTDGKKGLRLYAGGAVEYTAPGLEVSSNRLSYSSALLEAAENQCLYGGWPASAFLEKREKTAGGYRFFWRSYARGLPLVTEVSSCEMLVNDEGMPYYRRNFYVFSRDMGEQLPFPHYSDALFQVINLHRELFPNQEATLLALEPVYRVIPDVTGARAVPAWAVHFAETGRIFLHWQTMEPL
ncbi:MAG: hypothetical protein AB1796_00845 [Bacillota bacterium]